MAQKKCNRLLVEPNGFSLVEVLIAMVIILILVIAVTPIMVFNAQSNRYNRDTLTAKNLANERIESIRAMDFSAIGVVGGNPSGLVPTSETVTVDGVTYSINTYVNWEDQGGCVVSDNADWDVKNVRVEVTNSGYFYGDQIEVNESIETLISRDSEQPILLGANISVCVYNGWHHMVNVALVPESNINVTLSGPQSYSIFSTFRGSALFIDLVTNSSGTAGYDINVNPSGRIVFPGSFPKSVTVHNNSTVQEYAYVAIPSSLTLKLRDIYDHPVIISESGYSGTIVLEHSEGDSISTIVSGSDSFGRVIPSTSIGELWPFPKEYHESYRFDSIDLPGYELLINGIWDEEKGEAWDGYFDAEGQVKPLTIYLWQVPDHGEPSPISGSWTLAQSGNIDFTLAQDQRVAQHNNLLQNGQFSRDHQNNTSLSLPSSQLGRELEFIGTSILARGNELSINNKSCLVLYANYIEFENEISLRQGNQDQVGEIKLHTLATQAYDSSYDQLLYPENEPYLINEQPVLVPLEGAPPAILGSAIPAAHSAQFTGFPVGSQLNSTYYGVVNLHQNVYRDPQGNNRDLLVEAGIYYYPNGYSFLDDWNKSPEEGGLIRFID